MDDKTDREKISSKLDAFICPAIIIVIKITIFKENHHFVPG